jgi:hypothetical protein
MTHRDKLAEDLRLQREAQGKEWAEQARSARELLEREIAKEAARLATQDERQERADAVAQKQLRNAEKEKES